MADLFILILDIRYLNSKVCTYKIIFVCIQDIRIYILILKHL